MSSTEGSEAKFVHHIEKFLQSSSVALPT